MSEAKVQVCSVCGVRIGARDQVLFSNGIVGSRGRLWARVCQYVKKPGCINQDRDSLGKIPDEDFYSSPQGN